MIPSLPEQLIGNLLHDEHHPSYDNRNFQFANELERPYSAPPSSVQYGQQNGFYEAQSVEASYGFQSDFYGNGFQRAPVQFMNSWGEQVMPQQQSYGRFPSVEDESQNGYYFRQPAPKKVDQRNHRAQTDDHLNGGYGFGNFSSPGGFDQSWAMNDKRGMQEENMAFYNRPVPRQMPQGYSPEDQLMNKMNMMNLNGNPRPTYHSPPPSRTRFQSGEWFDYPNEKPQQQQPAQYNNMSNRQKVIGPGNRAPQNDYFPVMSAVYTEDSNEYEEGYPDYASKNRTTTASSLLEQFRNSKSTNLELRDIVGHFMEFSCDQHGSRFIQQKLEIAQGEKDLVFEEIYPEALRLMTDVFGNYVIQKFFEYGTHNQKRKLGEALQGHVLDLSLQMYGCRVVQKALEVIDPEQQIFLVQELEGHVLTCIKDQNGNHVIQKVIEHVDPVHTQFIVKTFITKVFKLATHPYGCRVIQRILEQPGINDVTSEDSPTRDIVQELLHCTISLVQDQYGNYVVQHVLKYGLKEDKHEIISQLRGKIVQFSQHKFASNVIEQCVEYGTLEHCQWLIDEIIAEPRALEVMMKHQYANYVVQKTLEVCSSAQREVLVEHIRPHISSLKKYTYGKHIIARMEKIQSSVY